MREWEIVTKDRISTFSDESSVENDFPWAA